MLTDVETLYADLEKRANRFGIEVRQTELDAEVPGEFDGPTITLNNDYDAVERAFYLAHSIGSIARWSTDFDRSQQVFRELRHAEQQSSADPARLERALIAYESFENETWEFAVWLLEDTGHEGFVAAFSNFGRADMDSMEIFHRTGKAPVWREFFAHWNKEIRQGTRSVRPFSSRPIPPFHAVAIPKQEIVQEDDGES